MGKSLSQIYGSLSLRALYLRWANGLECGDRARGGLVRIAESCDLDERGVVGFDGAVGGI